MLSEQRLVIGCALLGALTWAAKSTTAFSQEQKSLLNWQVTLQHLHTTTPPQCQQASDLSQGRQHLLCQVAVTAAC
jgi:hypothetical protein